MGSLIRSSYARQNQTKERTLRYNVIKEKWFFALDRIIVFVQNDKSFFNKFLYVLARTQT